MKYILSIIVILILGFVGYLGFKNSSIFQVKVEKPISATEEWPVYKNSKYGFEISHPTNFITEENESVDDIHFGTTLINHGNIYIKVFDTVQYNIKNLDDISYANKGAGDTTVLSSRDETNANGVIFREIKTVQKPSANASANAAIVLFINGSNAYALDWSCWPSKPCFNDETLGKMVQSIKFSN